MTENKDKIVTYDPSMASRAAEMFNLFNELWPGGFGGGIPFTEQRVRDMLDKTSAISDLIAVDEENELVGYCGLYPHWRDKNAAYISILGVTPKAKGKKFGKRLLLKSLEVAKKHGINRVDLHTWSGNLEAVPLYKKVGLFWVPETSVYMQDFIPGLLQTPIAKDYFEKHPDWYGNFKRELLQTQDKQIVDGMELYSYKFESQDDSLEAEVDRFGWNFCGFERVLDGKKLLVKTRLASQEIYIGIPNSMTLIIQNDEHDEVEAKIDVDEFKGLNWIEKFPNSVSVKKGETVKITREFTIDKETKLFRDNDRSCESIKTKVRMGSLDVELGTSGKLQSPIQLRGINENYFSTAPIGSEIKIPVDILNNTKQKITGKVMIEIDNLEGATATIPIELKADEIDGIEIPISIPVQRKRNKFTLQATPKLQFKGQEIELPTFKMPVFARTKDLIEIAEIKDRDRLYVITDKLSVRVLLEGGNLRIYQQENYGLNPLNHQTGPPYGLSLDNTLKYEYEFVDQDGYKLLILSAESLQVPGLLVKKHVKFIPGANEIEYWITYTNIHKNAIHASARTSSGFGGISLNPYSAKGYAYTPIGGKIIESDSLTNFLTDPLMPTETQFWSETWTAVKGLMTGDYSAWIWKQDNIEKIKLRQGSLSQLESKTIEIEPNETIEPVHLWFSFGYTTIQDVRNRWNQLVGHKEFELREKLVGPKITKALNAKLTGSKVLFAGDTVKKDFELMFVSAYPLQGTLSLVLPKDWEGGFIVDNEEQTTIPMPQLKPFTATPLEVTLKIPEKTKSPIENVKLHFSGEFEIDFDNYVIVTSKGQVNVEEKDFEGKKIYDVSNGELSFKVVAEIGGNLIRLEDSKGRNFLLDNYPEIQPKFFLEHYLGGSQPQLFHFVADEPFSEMEETKSQMVEENEWKGVKTTWTIKKEKQFLYGQKVELKYLTLPNSEIIRVVLSLDNKTTRTIPWIGSLLSDVGIQGSKEGNVIEAVGASGIWTRNSIKKQFISQGSYEKPYSRINKGNQSIAFVVPKGSNGSSVIADLGVMLLDWMLGLDYAMPKSKSTVEFAILINQPREKMIELREALEID
ncbi:MAG: GNAT family N-acetyltransferase [Candidatus Heimdallarchaeota archaeon]|nr:GNAT family N-acetyltransferase [Candidatus Heimdallarchaeota archaeon]